MKVFVAGATGVLGERLVEQFRLRGDEVVGLVRKQEGAQLVQSLGGDPRFADLFDADALARAAEGCEVVVHAKPRPGEWAANNRIRREGTRALAACARTIGARRFLFQSVVWVGRPISRSSMRRRRWFRTLCISRQRMARGSRAQREAR